MNRNRKLPLNKQIVHVLYRHFLLCNVIWALLPAQNRHSISSRANESINQRTFRSPFDRLTIIFMFFSLSNSHLHLFHWTCKCFVFYYTRTSKVSVTKVYHHSHNWETIIYYVSVGVQSESAIFGVFSNDE